jgi:3-phosphoglycerate kinase
MAFSKKTLRDLKLANKTVLVRVDYNVPLKNGRIQDNYRIQASVPTIQYLLRQKCRVILISHLGRPQGQPDKKLSLRPAGKQLAKLLGKPVQFAPDCVGEAAQAAVAALRPGQVLLLENLRFHKAEEKNNLKFARELASHAELFVQEGFGVVHRAHASTDAITRFLPSVAGFLLEQEVATITSAMENPAQPFVALIGGAKVADKIELLEKFVKKVDVLAIGGAIANTFLKAEGYEIGASVYEPEMVSEATRILHMALDNKVKIILPDDVVVSRAIDRPVGVRLVDWGTFGLDIHHYPKYGKAIPSKAHTVGAKEYILDVGPATANAIWGVLQTAQTIVWNGTLGLAEVEPFDHSSAAIEDELPYLQKVQTLIIGGGDTVSFVRSRWTHGSKPGDKLGHKALISTGGGAGLELMAGKKLPGVEKLLDKSAKVNLQ